MNNYPTEEFHNIQYQHENLSRRGYGQEMIDNGFEINFTAGFGNFEIYDISILSCRLGGDKS
jgi:hypothetical protein